MEHLLANILLTSIPNLDYLDAYVLEFGISLFSITFVWFALCAWITDKIAIMLEEKLD